MKFILGIGVMFGGVFLLLTIPATPKDIFGDIVCGFFGAAFIVSGALILATKDD